MVRKKKPRRPISLDEFISAENLAKTFGVSKQTVFRWRESGLPYIRVGLKVLFRESSVAAWLASREERDTGVKDDA